MFEPLVLNVADVIAAAQKAYKENRLSAQHVEERRPENTCRYRDENGFPCAIGAAMSDEFVQEVLKKGAYNESGIQYIEDEDLICADDIMALTLIQNAHDAWMQGAGTEQAFKAAIGL